MATIGSSTSDTFRAVTELIKVTKSKAKREQLLDLQMRLGAELQTLIDRQANESMPEYKAARAALAKATKAAKQAKGDLSKIADAVETLAQAIDLVAKLAAVLV